MLIHSIQVKLISRDNTQEVYSKSTNFNLKAGPAVKFIKINHIIKD